MEESYKGVKHLLNQVRTISDAYEIVAKNTGENFNLFQILGMETAEVRTHSKFLAELLNPNGSHLQGEKFLSIFIDYLNSLKIDTVDIADTQFLDKKIELIADKANIEIEKYIGKKTQEEGGRLDICITDFAKRLICIENKIYAGEQDNQLLRYSRFGNEFTDCHLFFLTLNGNKCTTIHEDEGKTVYSISYKKHIKEWLELCKKEAVDLPILRESIGQYINLINKLTHQTTNKKMENDIIQLLLINDENLESAKLINRTIVKIDQELIQKLDELVELGNSNKPEIDRIIKESLPNSYLRMVKRFVYKGIKMIRYDIVLASVEDVIAIQLEIIDHKIYNNVWANNRNFSNSLKDSLLDKIDFNYEYGETKDEILNKIKEQIKMISALSKSLHN